MKYKLMPEEPTAEMHDAGYEANLNPPRNDDGSVSVRVQTAHIYTVMWQAAPDSEPCQWAYDDIDDAWDTACGNKFCFTDSGPKENGYLFCPGCGHELKE